MGSGETGPVSAGKIIRHFHILPCALQMLSIRSILTIVLTVSEEPEMGATEKPQVLEYGGAYMIKELGW
jgi:hypothetical protein